MPYCRLDHIQFLSMIEHGRQEIHKPVIDKDIPNPRLTTQSQAEIHELIITTASFMSLATHIGITSSNVLKISDSSNPHRSAPFRTKLPWHLWPKQFPILIRKIILERFTMTERTKAKANAITQYQSSTSSLQPFQLLLVFVWILCF